VSAILTTRVCWAGGLPGGLLSLDQRPRPSGFFELKGRHRRPGESLALKCDRLEFSSRVEPFHFLGGLRLFPFTIYHLAILFDRPVVFCTAVAGGSDAGLRRVRIAGVQAGSGGGPRGQHLRGTAAFPGRPDAAGDSSSPASILWFNFLPLNPEVPAAGCQSP